MVERFLYRSTHEIVRNNGLLFEVTKLWSSSSVPVFLEAGYKKNGTEIYWYKAAIVLCVWCSLYSFGNKYYCFKFSSVQLLSHVQLYATPWTAACQISLSITNSWSLLKLMSKESVMLSNHHLILCCLLLLPPSIFPGIRVFSNESDLRIRWPKYWTFSLSITPSNEYSGLISFRMDWLDLLAVQGTLKSLLQHHSSKASILQCSAFFMVQLSHPYMTTRKNHSFD